MQIQGRSMNGGEMNGQPAQMRNSMQGNKSDEQNAMNIFTNYLVKQQSQLPLGGWQQTFSQQRRLTSMLQM